MTTDCTHLESDNNILCRKPLGQSGPAPRHSMSQLDTFVVYQLLRRKNIRMDNPKVYMFSDPRSSCLVGKAGEKTTLPDNIFLPHKESVPMILAGNRIRIHKGWLRTCPLSGNSNPRDNRYVPMILHCTAVQHHIELLRWYCQGRNVRMGTTYTGRFRG